MTRMVPCKEVLGQILGATLFGDMSFTPRRVRHRIFQTVKRSEADKLRLGVLYDLADSGLLNHNINTTVLSGRDWGADMSLTDAKGPSHRHGIERSE
jgi:hypothetical protein